MTCSHEFRTFNPHRVLKSVYAAQTNVNPSPAQDEDFLRLKSREIIGISNLGISDTAVYSILTKLAVHGLLNVFSNPDHEQGFVYSISHQGMRCCRCKYYQEGFEPAPAGFVCGPVEVICDF